MKIQHSSAFIFTRSSNWIKTCRNVLLATFVITGKWRETSWGKVPNSKLAKYSPSEQFSPSSINECITFYNAKHSTANTVTLGGGEVINVFVLIFAFSPISPGFVNRRQGRQVFDRKNSRNLNSNTSLYFTSHPSPARYILARILLRQHVRLDTVFSLRIVSLLHFLSNDWNRISTTASLLPSFWIVSLLHRA